jgi:hypothetical protein
VLQGATLRGNPDDSAIEVAWADSRKERMRILPPLFLQADAAVAARRGQLTAHQAAHWRGRQVRSASSRCAIHHGIGAGGEELAREPSGFSRW